jgi:preprotein translocase subunit SecY
MRQPVNPSWKKSELFRIVLITIGLVILYRLLRLIPLPFIHQGEFKAFSRIFRIPGFPISIMGLGIMPYVFSYISVEISSLSIPFLKKLRNEGGHEGRLRLKYYAMIATIVWGSLLGYWLMKSLSEMKGLRGQAMLPMHNALDYIFPIATLVGGVFLSVFIAELISKYGIGHGISMLMLAGPADNLFQDFSAIYRNLELDFGINQVMPDLLLKASPYVLLFVFGFLLLYIAT